MQSRGHEIKHNDTVGAGRARGIWSTITGLLFLHCGHGPFRYNGSKAALSQNRLKRADCRLFDILTGPASR